MAAQQTAQGQIEASERAILLYGFAGILRAGGGEAARWRRVGADELLIEHNGQQQQPLQRPTDEMPETLHRREVRRD